MIAHPLSASGPPAVPSEMVEPAIPLGAEPESAIHGPIAGRYDLGDRIARGGMGIVYRAHDRLLNRTVAVKVLRSRFMDRPDLLRRFLAEARINGRLQHPGVVPVYEVGTLPDTRPFIAMKLIVGETLSRKLRERTSPADNLAHHLKTFESLCQAVAYAHRQGVIHRDLKPDNVMVGEFGEVQVMDWGLAKFLNPADAVAPTPDGFEAVEKSVYLSGDGTTPAGDHATEATAIRAMGPDEAGAGFTTAGEVFGTLPFMPPEQARGEIDRVDRRGDVFALGAILCQILTGQPPYFGSPESLRDQARGGKLFGAYVLLDRCGADQALVLLAKHCLAVDADTRPADASVLASMVTQCLEGLQDRTRQLEMSRLAAEARLVEAEAREKLARKARQLARMLAVAGVLVAGLLAAWIGYFTRHQAARVNEEAQTQTIAAQPAESAPTTERDTGLAAALEQWRTEQAAAKGGVDAAATAQRCRELFATHGVDVSNSDPAIIGERIKNDPAVVAIATALTEWLAVTPDANERQRLAAVLKAADHPANDSWVTALDRGNPEELAKIADGTANDAPPAIGLAVVANQLVQGGRSSEAERLLTNGVRRYPNDFHLNSQLGTTLRGSGKSAEAVRYLSAARAARPTDANVNLELGLALADSGRTDEALDVLRSTVQIDPKLAIAHKRIGDLLVAQGRADDARASYVKVIEVNPTDASAQIGVGKAELARGDLDAAHKAFTAALSSPAHAAAAHAGVGEIHKRKWEASKAVAEFRAAVAADPKNVDYRVGLVDALRVANDMTGALREARLAATALPTSAAAHRTVGDILHLSGDLMGAVAAYRAAIKLDANDAETHQRLAGTYDAQKDFKSAATEFQAVADLRTKDVKAQLALGRARVKAGDPSAAEAFRRALALEPADATVRQQLGRCLATFGDEKGIDELKIAMTSLPESGEVRADLGNAYLALGQFRIAATTLREAADKFPADHPKVEAAKSLARTAMRMAALEDRLPQVMSGAVTMSTPVAWAEVGEVCRRTKRYAAAARFYGEAAEGDPKYAAQAATCAALAGFGRGNDAADVSEVARAEWRKTALTMFQKSADLAKDPILGSLREPNTMAELPADEREAWKLVWEGR
jgi:eukaryotic-like serine/threonine-protein kinase